MTRRSSPNFARELDELDELAAPYFESTENILRQDYLHTRATKVRSTHDRAAVRAVFARAADEAALVRVAEVGAVPDGVAASAARYTRSGSRCGGRSTVLPHPSGLVWALVRASSIPHLTAQRRPPGTLFRRRRPAPRSRTPTRPPPTPRSLCSSKGEQRAMRVHHRARCKSAAVLAQDQEPTGRGRTSVRV